jgi:lysophospholipase L1-like esterase
MKLRLSFPRLALFAAGWVIIILFTAPGTALAQVEPARSSPAANSAIQPEPRDANWVKRHDGFVALAKQGGIDVLFLGDSITDFWRRDQTEKQVGGKKVWDASYAPLHAANFGISADRTQHVLWRMENGELNGISPKVVVLMIGTNNTGLERDNVTPRNSVPQTIEGVKAVVQGLRTKLPATKILLLAIFPRADNLVSPPQIKEINAALAKLDDGKFVRFLDIGPKFLTADGTLTQEVMPDLLHPNLHGYEIWADAMRAQFAEMLK